MGYRSQEVVVEEEPSREVERKGLSAEVRLEEARELEKKGQLDEAILAYGRLFGGNSTGFKVVVMSAANGLFRSVWRQNSPATEGRVTDRKCAYWKLNKFIEVSKRLVRKMNDEELKDRKAFVGMLKRFEESGEAMKNCQIEIRFPDYFWGMELQRFERLPAASQFDVEKIDRRILNFPLERFK